MDFAESERLARNLTDSLGPLGVDIDGTLTGPERGLDPRVVPVLRAWPSPVVIATGKAVPYPVSLCEFLGIEPRVIAENGGLVLPARTSTFIYSGDREAASTVAAEYQERGFSLGWGDANLVNRWRETELAISRESPLAPLEAIAEAHDLAVVDTGFAYHVHSSDVDKGVGLETIASELDIESTAFAYVGDSPNDVPAFGVAGTSVAVANGSAAVRDAADHVTDSEYGSGFLEAVRILSEREV